jgi:hypothetical protein
MYAFAIIIMSTVDYLRQVTDRQYDGLLLVRSTSAGLREHLYICVLCGHNGPQDQRRIDITKEASGNLPASSRLGKGTYRQDKAERNKTHATEKRRTNIGLL